MMSVLSSRHTRLCSCQVRAETLACQQVLARSAMSQKQRGLSQTECPKRGHLR